ncbi:MAG: DUF1611 domain-containing protein [Woeseiaceae bacterium]|nr:DUF1611 domain-containing protein [Woeseiaceae bacterium]
MMIAGRGIPIDSVVADFVSGAAEVLSPDNDADHWDVIEGQGSLFHPGYAAVSLGLLHGSQPDAVVVCHDAARSVIGEWEHCALPSIADCIDLNLRAGRLTNPDIRCAGVSVNTSSLPAAEREPYLDRLAAETGLPCVDPLAGGMQPDRRDALRRLTEWSERRAAMEFALRVEEWALRQPFRITGSEWHHATCVVVELACGDARGRGEAQGVSYLGETADSMTTQIRGTSTNKLKGGIDRDRLHWPRCSRPAVRATRSTAHCGISRRSAVAARSGH